VRDANKQQLATGAALSSQAADETRREGLQ
jgi:hypothetical protein